jgi:uncharacterized membrane protein YhaH (DUF805 family)
MTFSQALSSFFSNYVNFEGRARRSELWWAILFSLLGNIVIGGSFALIGDPGVIVGLFNLILFVPFIALWVRRLHDLSLSGLWYLLFFVPIAGVIAFFIWALSGSSPSNQWGPPADSFW